jgi:hypothetical protein
MRLDTLVTGDIDAPADASKARTHDAFMSYSHAADGKLAPALQVGLQRFARPWNRRRALWVFRDQTGLPVTPALWSTIRAALDDSRWFIVLGSPAAAESRWVEQEIGHWLRTRSAATILPVVTDGEWVWDAEAGDFDWARSTAVPPALRGAFTEEPRFLDLRWAKTEAQLGLGHSRFRAAVVELAAPLHGVSMEDLESEDLAQHRHALRVRRGLLAALVALSLVAGTSGAIATVNARRAETSSAEAARNQAAADTAEHAADTATREAKVQQQHADAAERRATELSALGAKQERAAKEQEARALKAATKADAAETRARIQEARARRAQAEAGLSRAGAEKAKAEATKALRARNLARKLESEAVHAQRAAEEKAEKADKGLRDAQRELAAAKQELQKIKDELEKAKQAEPHCDGNPQPCV